jgi:hypothetical protein
MPHLSDSMFLFMGQLIRKGSAATKNHLMLNFLSLPIVDFGNVVGESSAEKRRFEAEKLVDAFTEFGFAMVQGSVLQNSVSDEKVFEQIFICILLVLRFDADFHLAEKVLVDCHFVDFQHVDCQFVDFQHVDC